MDYQDINNFLNTLQLSKNSNESNITHNRSNSQFNPILSTRNLQYNSEAINQYNSEAINQYNSEAINQYNSESLINIIKINRKHRKNY